MIHVAVLKANYIRDILAGNKTIESRLTKTNQPPHGSVFSGERLFIKASGGPFMATALADRVQTFTDQTPRDIAKIRKRFGKQIGGDDAYWQSKQHSRFVTLIDLADIEPLAVGPAYKPAYMKAWYVLDDALSPLRDWTITPGALRNRYACLPAPADSRRTPGETITLDMPSGETITTELARGRMLRWRGWAELYETQSAQAGDILRFTAIDGGRYAVRLIKR